jgi:5-methyltetrahydrofolate--homocysteine methyltransferase
MASVFDQIAACVEQGKTDAATNIPAGSRGQPGVVELVATALGAGESPEAVLKHGLLAGMQVVGRKFAANEVFIPEVLISARAMRAGLGALRPAFTGRPMPQRGVFVIGTVRGDMHDIGKNLVGMILEGAGWQVVDLGIDCAADAFTAAVQQRPGCVVGLSALLTTTMLHMRDTIAAIRASSPDTVILVGGAPVSAAFAEEIGASGYAADPVAAIELLDRLVPAGGHA